MKVMSGAINGLSMRSDMGLSALIILWMICGLDSSGNISEQMLPLSTLDALEEGELTSHPSVPLQDLPTQTNLTSNKSEMSWEKHLITFLLSRYRRVGKMGRPVLDTSTPVSVNFSLGLIQMELNEREKVLSLSMWTRYVWRDEYLTWDPADYGGVSLIRLEPQLIWIPDIMLYNTADVDIEARDALAVITSDGHVRWYPHCIFRSSCSVDVTNFPFDEQFCHMWFGSWTHSSREVDINMGIPSGIDLSTFQFDHKESSAWDIFNISAERKLLPSEEEDPNFAVLTFDLHLRRKLVFSTYMLTMPCVFLACLTLVVFWLPPERPDRTALAMSSFASFMVLLLILVEAAMPTASSVPTLGVYYCFNMVIIMVAIVLSSVVVNISRGSRSQRPPSWLTIFTVHILARIMRIRHLENGDSKRKGLDCEKASEIVSTETTELVRVDTNQNGDMDNRDRNVLSPERETSSAQTTAPRLTANSSSGYLSSLEYNMSEVRRCVERLEARLEHGRQREGEARANLAEWKAVAVVLDRFFFAIYLVLIAASLVVLFPRPKS